MREVLVFAAGWLLGNAGMWWLLTQARPRREAPPPEPEEGIVDYVCASGEHEDCPAYDCACWCHLPERDEWEWDDATLAALHDDTDLPGPVTCAEPDQLVSGQPGRAGEHYTRAREHHTEVLLGPASGRAGELHYGEPPLPAILQLGREYDGSDRTFERSEVRRQFWLWEMRADVEAVRDMLAVAA